MLRCSGRISNQLSVSTDQYSVSQCAPFGVTEWGVVTFDVPWSRTDNRAIGTALVSGENLIATT